MRSFKIYRRALETKLPHALMVCSFAHAY